MTDLHIAVRDALREGEVIPTALVESLISLCEAQQDALAELHGTGKRGDVARQVSVVCQMVRHELANPLTVVAGNVEMVLTRRLDEDKQMEMLQRAASQVHRMWEFLDNVSELAGSSRALMPRERQERVGLAGLIDEAIVLASEYLDPARIEISVPEDLVITTVPSRVLQILTNLLVNAGKYTPAGSPVRLAAWRDGEVVRLEVADRGPGIPAELADAVFEPLVRGVLSADVPGRGLGLYLARAFARSLEADLDLVPRDGGGTVAQIVLPQRRAEDAAHRAS